MITKQASYTKMVFKGLGGGQGEKLIQDNDASVFPLVIYMLGYPQVLWSVSPHQKKQSLSPLPWSEKTKFFSQVLLFSPESFKLHVSISYCTTPMC